MQELTNLSQFTDAIQSPTVVDFWAPWCGPCKALTPVLEDVASTQSTVNFLKVNVDTEVGQELSSKFAVASLPTLMYFEGGVKKRQLIGNTAKSKILDFISGE